MIKMQAYSLIGILMLSTTALLGQANGCAPSAIINIFAPPGIDDSGSSGDGASIDNANDNADDQINGNDNVDDGMNDNGNVNGNDNVDDSNGPPPPADLPELEYEVEMFGGGGVMAKAKYRQEPGRLRLSFEIEYAAPGSTHVLVVDGVTVGELVADALGFAEVEFDTNIEPGHLPWPDAFPAGLAAGTPVQVGDLQGVLGA